jgi:anti-anti-sigma factor
VHRINVETEGPAAVVTASGELDAFVADELGAAFAGAGETVVADLESVSFMDSTALGVLVRAVREVESRSGQIRVVLPAGMARRIFEITTLDRVLPVAASRSDALAEVDER